MLTDEQPLCLNSNFEDGQCLHLEQDHLENDLTGLKECQLCCCTEWLPGVK